MKEPLKLKLLHLLGQSFKTTQKAKLAVFEYIEVWYNRKRLHSSLRYKTPTINRIRVLSKKM